MDLLRKAKKGHKNMAIDKPVAFNYEHYIEAKEELEEYKASGLTPEQVGDLAERDKIKKPRICYDVDGGIAYEFRYCGADVRPWFNFCSFCGRRLTKWAGDF